MDENAETIELFQEHHTAVLRSANVPEEVHPLISHFGVPVVDEYLFICAFEGMPEKQLQRLIKRLETAKVKGDIYKQLPIIQDARKKFLQDIYKENAELSHTVEDILARVTQMASDNDELRTAVDQHMNEISGMQSENFARQVEEYEHLLSDRENKIKELKEKIISLTAELEEQRAQVRELEDQTTAIGAGIREEREAVPGIRGWIMRRRRDRESRNFVEVYLASEAYNMEQKEYLLSCFENGCTLDELKEFANPALPPSYMERIREVKKAVRKPEACKDNRNDENGSL